jgi:hypothetical protein
MSLQYVTQCKKIGDITLKGVLIELENAVIVLVWEGKNPRLGSLSITLPNKTGSHLMGEREQILGRAIGEHFSTRFEKIALVSLNISLETGLNAKSIIIDLARSLAEKGKD